MAERTLRGARLGGQSFEDERGIEFAARQRVAYVCAQGHDFEIPMAAEAEVPPLWECPRCGAEALRRDGDTLADLRVAITGTNPRPVLLHGTRELCGGPLDARVFQGLDALVRDQIMSMKTTFTPGHYRRRVAGVLARRLVARLFAG